MYIKVYTEVSGFDFLPTAHIADVYMSDLAIALFQEHKHQLPLAGRLTKSESGDTILRITCSAQGCSVQEFYEKCEKLLSKYEEQADRIREIKHGLDLLESLQGDK